MASILVLYYTQSGQLEKIVESFVRPFIGAGHQVELCRIRPKKDFPFPWTSDTFFDAMPESVLGEGIELEAPALKSSNYDLVVLAYQPWFLSPSIPTTSLFNRPEFISNISGANVVTLIGSRNMWLRAQEAIKEKLKIAGANLVGTIALKDRHNNYASAVSILHWMLTGKKEKKWGIFPTPGVSEADIKETEKYGALCLEHITSGNVSSLQQSLVKSGAIEVDTKLMFIEGRAGFLFKKWATLIKKQKEKRAFFLVLFKYYLLIALFGVAPLVVNLYYYLFYPFLKSKVEKQKKYYLGI